MSRNARIWATADGRYVGDGHLDARVLVAGPDDDAPADFDPATFEPGDQPAEAGEKRAGKATAKKKSKATAKVDDAPTTDLEADQADQADEEADDPES